MPQGTRGFHFVNLRGYFCFLLSPFLFSASSFSPTFMDRFSASASTGFQSFFLTILLSCSACSGSFSIVSLTSFSACSSEVTSSKASSGQNSTHYGSPLQRSQATANPVSE